MARWCPVRFTTLPDDVPYSAGASAARISLTIPIVLCLVINALLIGHIDSPTDQTIKMKWSLLQHRPQSADHLVLGDSTGLHGVLPAQLGTELGGSWLNLCTNARMLVAHDAWMLQWYIKHYGPPAEVVVVHSLNAWRYSDDDSTYQLASKVPLPWGYWRDMQPPLPATQAHLGEMFMTRHFPLYAQNKTIDTLLQKPVKKVLGRLGNNAEEDSPEPSASTKTADEALGFVSLGDKPNRSELQRELVQWQTMPPFELSAINREALSIMMRLSEQHHFRLYVVTGSICQSILDMEPGRRYAVGADEALAKLTAGHPTVSYLRNIPPFPAEQMRDSDHVILSAARLYTSYLAREIRAERQRP